MLHGMCECRVYGLVLDDVEEHVYVAGESAGGNTIFRWNGQADSVKSSCFASGPEGSLVFADRTFPRALHATPGRQCRLEAACTRNRSPGAFAKLRWMAKSAAHVGYVGRVRASDGVVVGGTLHCCRRCNVDRLAEHPKPLNPKPKSLKPSTRPWAETSSRQTRNKRPEQPLQTRIQPVDKLSKTMSSQVKTFPYSHPSRNPN